MRRYHLQDREDYHKYASFPPISLFLLCRRTTCRYNKLCGSLRAFAHRVAQLPAQDPFRTRMEAQLLAKLYDMGVLNAAAKLSDVENKLTVAAFCRRRLAVIVCMSKMAETVSAVRFYPPIICGKYVVFIEIWRRRRSSSSRGMCASGLILSRIPHTWLHGKISFLGTTTRMALTNFGGIWRTS